MTISHQIARRLDIGEGLHNSPRFGNTAEFSDLLSDNNDIQIEYMRGICATAILLICFFLLWSLLLCTCKCCCLGKRRVGFLSGAPYDARTHKGQLPNKRAVRGRIVFGFSGVLFIIFTFLMIFLGIANIKDTTDEWSNGAEMSRVIFADSRPFLKNFRNVAKLTQVKRDVLVLTLSKVFEVPLEKDAPTNELLEEEEYAIAGNNETTIAGNETSTADKFVYNGIDLQERVAVAIEKLQNLGNFIKGPAKETQTTLREGEETCENVRDGLSDIELDEFMKGVGIPLVVIVGAMLLIMGLSTYGISNTASACFTAWFLTPLFVLVLFLLVLWMSAMSIAGIVNSDFCNGGSEATPEATILAIMDQKGIAYDSWKYRAVEYTISGCEYAIPREGVEPLQEFQDFQEILNAARDNIASLMDDFSSIGLDVLTNNLEYDATEVQSMLIEIRANIQELADDLISLIDTLVCEHIHGIYEKVIHDATCTKSYDGLAWTFSSLLIMVFFGFLMLQFRSAMYPLAGLERDGDYSWNEAKETDIASANTNINGDEPGYKLEDAPASSVQDEDLQSNGQREEEVPMGGTAQQRYDDVGDANPSAEAPGQQENFVPRKSAWA